MRGWLPDTNDFCNHGSHQLQVWCHLASMAATDREKVHLAQMLQHVSQRCRHRAGWGGTHQRPPALAARSCWAGQTASAGQGGGWPPAACAAQPQGAPQRPPPVWSCQALPALSLCACQTTATCTSQEVAFYCMASRLSMLLSAVNWPPSRRAVAAAWSRTPFEKQLKGMTGAHKMASGTLVCSLYFCSPQCHTINKLAAPSMSARLFLAQGSRNPSPPQGNSCQDTALTTHSHWLSSGLCFRSLHGQVGLHVL